MFIESQDEIWSTECVCVCACMLSHFSCVWLCDPMDHSLPGSSAHGILQARILGWVAISSSRRSSWPRGQTGVSYVSCIGRWILYLLVPPGKWDLYVESANHIPPSCYQGQWLERAWRGWPVCICSPVSSPPQGHTPHAKPSWHLQNHLISIPTDSRTILPAIWLHKAVLRPFTKISRKSSSRTPGCERVGFFFVLFFCFFKKAGFITEFPF